MAVASYLNLKLSNDSSPRIFLWLLLGEIFPDKCGFGPIPVFKRSLKLIDGGILQIPEFNSFVVKS